MKMWLRILIDAVIIIVVLVFVVGTLALLPRKMPVTLYPSDLGLPYENISLLTSDAKKLSGWLIRSPKSKAIIVCLHGYPANKADILPVVSFLYPEFSLLLFDFRAHGQSEGRRTYFGLKETLDVESAIRFIKSKEQTKNLKIGVWGYSLGGAVGILTAAKSSEIKALVTDSAFANFPEMVTHYYWVLGPAKYILGGLSRFLGRCLLRQDFILNSPEYAVDKIRCPILLIHSEEDEYVPADHARRLFNRAPQPKELWLKKGRHNGLGDTGAGGYEDKILGFFKRNLLVGGG